MKVIFRIVFCLIISIFITYFSHGYNPSANLLNALFTISGIMFAIGLGLIVSFSPEGVKNPSYIQKIRQTVNEVRNNFLMEFMVVCLVYILSTLPFFTQEIVITESLTINFLIFFGLQLAMSIFYFSLNFLSIQKLKNDIFDVILKEKSAK